MLAHFNPTPLVASPASAVAILHRAESVSAANLGVVFFFTLSSFLLTYLAVKERDETGGFRTGAFYLRRGFRIWPLYFAVLAAALLLLRHDDWTRRHAWMFAAFVSNWSLALNHVGGHVDHSSPVMAILWSIAVEEQFYLVFPWILLFALRSRRCAGIAAATLVAVGVSTRVVFLFLPVSDPAMGASGGLYYATTAYADVFLCGAAAGWLAARGQFDWIRRRGIGWAILIAVALLGVAWHRQCWYPYGMTTPVLYGATGAAFALAILWTVAHPDAWAGRFLRWSPTRTLGRLSYGIYLWHPIGAILLLSWISPFDPFGPMPQSRVDLVAAIWFLAYLALAVGLAAISYGAIEVPFLRLRSRLMTATDPSRRGVRWIVTATACGVLVWAGAQTIRTVSPIWGNRSTATLSSTLGVRVDLAPGEPYQYLVRAPQGSVDFSRVGTVHENLGYAVGVTLPDGVRIGFRYAPLPGP